MNKEIRDFNSIRRISGQASNRPDSSRFSVATYWSLTSENDAEVQDELAKCMKIFRYFREFLKIILTTYAENRAETETPRHGH